MKKLILILAILVLCLSVVSASADIRQDVPTVPTYKRNGTWSSHTVTEKADGSGYVLKAAFTTDQAGDFYTDFETMEDYLEFTASLIFNGRTLKSYKVRAYWTGEYYPPGTHNSYVFKANLKFDLGKNYQKGTYTLQVKDYVPWEHAGPYYEVSEKKVTLKGIPDDLPQPKSISISGKTTVTAGKTITLKAKVSPSSVSQKVTWSSSDKKIATVSKNGVVTGKKAGKVKITAVSAINSKIKKSVTVTVKATVPVSDVSLNKTNFTMIRKGKLQLIPIITPKNATNQEVFWKSTDTSVATVDENGLVTAVGIGSCKIRAYSKDDKSKKATCNITVTKAVEIDSTNFPNGIFREYVKQFDANNDGVFDKSELANVTTISVPNQGIKSLRGIEYFTSLTSLDCSENQLNKLNISSNMKLVNLNCSHNNLAEIDVTRNTKLESLICYENSIAKLDISRNAALINLHCWSNRLTALNIRSNPKLKSVMCCFNQIGELDIRKNPILLNLVKKTGTPKDIGSYLSYTDGSINLMIDYSLKLITE